MKCPSPLLLLPLSKSDGGFSPTSRDVSIYRKKCIRLEKEIDMLKKSIADNSIYILYILILIEKQYDEDILHLKGHQVSELRKRDETIDEYYIRLKEMERSGKKESAINNNNIKANEDRNAKQFVEELEKIKKEKKEIEERMKREKEILIRQNNELKRKIAQQNISLKSSTTSTVTLSSSSSSDVNNNNPNSPIINNNKSEIEIIISPLFQEKFIVFIIILFIVTILFNIK